MQSPSGDSDGASGSQKSYIDHDLIHMLMGTIDSLSRSIAPTGDDETAEEDPSDLSNSSPPKPEPLQSSQPPSGTSANESEKS
jgi:hypothetical protein